MATTSSEESAIQNVLKDIKTSELYAARDGRFMPKNHSFLEVLQISMEKWLVLLECTSLALYVTEIVAS